MSSSATLETPGRAPGVARSLGLRALAGLPVEELRRELAEAKRLRSILEARVLEITSLLDATATASGAPIRAIPEFELMEHSGMTRREAGDTVRRAHLVEEAPMLGDALAEGVMTAGHLDAISRGARIAGDGREAFLNLVPDLIEAASGMSVGDFTALVTSSAKGFVTDGGLALFENQRKSTHLKMWNDKEGMLHLRGSFDPESGAVLQSRLQTTLEAMFHSGDKAVPIDHHPWVEANDHRRAHALVALVAGSTGVGDARVRSDVVVHIDLDTLVHGLSTSSTHRSAFGADLPVETIRRISCDAGIIPLVLNGAGVPLDIGRSQRLASAGQRRALEATHTSCAFPGCDVAYHHCQIHHIDYWENGGRTDLANMVPLCSQHHHAAHEGGWTLNLDP
ncbi:MAG: DUF222 domain-containing protein, partial [Actinomycetota bacterium]